MTTVGEALRTAAGRLAAAGIESPRLEAEFLLAAVLGEDDRFRLHARPERPLSPGQSACLDAWVARRAAREPLAYILGRWEFWSRAFEVTPATLIPRPETERLVEAALALRDRGGWTAPRVLDLGTGSGVIAVTLAAEWPDARVVAVDASPEALAVARRNALAHGVAGRVRLVCSDWGSALAPRGWAFDLVAANPPYVAAGDMAWLPPEVRDHEPRRALHGGPDGLDAVRRILAEARRLLRPGGRLLCEIGWDQAPAAAGLARRQGLDRVRVHRDLAGRDRVLAARRP
ncbi:peptide chain release factor N(5)-glutamine methyltransferase [Dissulfurirhabdus thermomarina]|uniref:Release factor glutamine methyltransferase n=1 Tax=Dissulfurirhabdus thermomarina TaxID=1765737 RepID=A0A6N9TNU8_DISTH|nr:peptide chain release factor N(5)-glutamine methyltransferase [Dissulfurirhabdus thermomarina]NDY42829.1 peptide chain release factor N(5)-glutamine methyltransferase [Dissulfurirhabdus thermomarina]NMX23624.1 peptide chain release factor N(5)-glutamine methyltransferase [Dissulfurirhabdus thermomarina]